MDDNKHAAVVEVVRSDLRDHLGDFCRQAPDFIDQYAAATLSGSLTRPQARMHPKLAAFLRELVLDAAMMDRRGTCGGVAPSAKHGAVDSAQPSRRKVAA